IARDVGDQLRAEEIERELGKMEFVNLIAHELRNPLAAISGAVQFLADDREAIREDKRPLVDLLVRQVNRSQSLINDLLDLSRLQSGKFNVSLEAVPLDAALGDALLASPAPEGKQVDLEVPSDLGVVADPVRLQQVFTNLLTNAYKYGGPSISVHAAHSKNVVEVSFADNGRGLPDDYVEQVFDPFVRGETAGQTGSGLGLAITKGLVEAQGGSIRYEAVEPQGARFVCTLKVPA
ncbi:MAG: hypothetical protein QOH90_1199, partial [Actinomycetota bacterium]|nr:hypothetical protein [Actinomycetota bacterium]